MRRTNYSDKFANKTYHLAKSGLKNKQISDTLGIAPATFSTWLRKYPKLRKALKKGREFIRKDNGEIITFKEHVFGNMPTDVRDSWNVVNAIENASTRMGKIEELCKKNGKRFRQHLLICAILNSNYNITRACESVGVSFVLFNQWKEKDDDFRKVFDYLLESKKDFYEECFIKLVASGDSPATIYAVKTQLRDRGYGDVSKSEVRKVVDNRLTIKIEDMNLPTESKRKLLEEFRSRKVIDSKAV